MRFPWPHAVLFCSALCFTGSHFLLPTPAAAAPPRAQRAETLAPLPPGATLPVSLHGSVRAGKTPAGEAVVAHTTQRIPLAGSQYLPSGVAVLGTVASSDPSGGLTLRFTSIRYKGQSLPLSVRALAIANFVAASETTRPANGSTDRGNPSAANWTTAQVGGEQVVRSGWYGPVVNATTQTVGSADPFGVYALPRSPADPPRAVGVFSTTAHGLFGYPAPCTLDSATADIAIRCAHSRPELHNGDNLLLEVLPAGPAHP